VAQITKQQLDTLNGLLKKLSDGLEDSKAPGSRPNPLGGDRPQQPAQTTREVVQNAIREKEVAEELLKVQQLSAELQEQKRAFLEENAAILNEEEQKQLQILQGKPSRT